jgi:hypothetical protein
MVDVASKSRRLLQLKLLPPVSSLLLLGATSSVSVISIDDGSVPRAWKSGSIVANQADCVFACCRTYIAKCEAGRHRSLQYSALT